MTLLEIKNVSHRFRNGTEALKEVSFSVLKGELLIISGKNGSGKSVLMRHINGLYRPTSGDILFRGTSIFKQLLHVRQKIGLVFQNPDNQIVSQIVKMDVAFGPENLHLEKTETERKVAEALQSVGLLDKIDHRTYNLSGGEKRKLAIAGVLAMDPEIIILDEPFSNLDFPGVKHVLRKIIDLHELGHTIICITHELDKILYHADRLIIMDNGRIVSDDIPVTAMMEAPSYGIRIPGDIGKESPEVILGRMSWLK